MHRVVLIYRTTHIEPPAPVGARRALRLVPKERATAVRVTARRRQRQWRLSLFAGIELLRRQHRPNCSRATERGPITLRVIVGVHGTTCNGTTPVATATHGIAYELTLSR